MAVVTLVDFGADCVAVADFNQDGAAECVVGRAGSTELAIYAALGEESPHACIRLDSLPIDLSQGDFDADGTPELAVALIDARISLYVPDSRLNFSLARTIALPAPPKSLAVGPVAGRAHLIVATATSIYAVDPMEADPEMPTISATVSEVTERLEALAEHPNYDALIAHAPITQREREVVSLAVRGMQSREIGGRLFIGERTVETHLAHAYSKLGVRSRFELLMSFSDDRSSRSGGRAR